MVRNTFGNGAGARPAAVDEVGAEHIYEALRNAVLDQRLPPGMQLKEQALADAFGVNRAVVRAALSRLESVRLVEHRPNRGVFVAMPSIAEARDIFAARRVIEAAIVQTLAAAPQAAVMDALQALVLREQTAYQRGELREALRLSIEFHRQLARYAGNSVLENFLEELVARTPLVVLSYRGLDSPSCSLNEHAEVLAAIAAGEGARAVELMNHHIGHIERQLELGFREAAKEGDIGTLLGLAGRAP